MNNDKPLDELRSEDAFDYLLYLVDDRKVASSTVNQHMAALRLFYREILRHSLPKDLIRCNKTPKRLPEVLTPREVTNLFEATNNLYQ